MSKQIKIGVRGFDGSAQAQYIENATNAVYCMWVELPSGRRIGHDELTGVRLTFRVDGLADTTIEFHHGEWTVDGEVDLIGVPFVVLVDRDGQPLPSRHEEDRDE